MNIEKLLWNKWFTAPILFTITFLFLTYSLVCDFLWAGIIVSITFTIFFGAIYVKILKQAMPNKLKWGNAIIAGLLTIIYFTVITLLDFSVNKLFVSNIGFYGVLIFVIWIFSTYVLPCYSLLTLGSYLMIQKLKK